MVCPRSDECIQCCSAAHLRFSRLSSCAGCHVRLQYRSIQLARGEASCLLDGRRRLGDERVLLEHVRKRSELLCLCTMFTSMHGLDGATAMAVWRMQAGRTQHGCDNVAGTRRWINLALVVCEVDRCLRLSEGMHDGRFGSSNSCIHSNLLLAS